MHIKLSLLFTIIFFFASRAASAQMRHERLGIVFTIPGGWEVTEEKKAGSGAIAMNCVDLRKGYSGTALIFYNDNNKTREEMIRMNMEDMPGFQFGPIIDTTIGKFNAKMCTFVNVDESGFSVSGSMISFKACGKTVMLALTEATDDHEKNLAGYNKLLSSFSCK